MTIDTLADWFARWSRYMPAQAVEEFTACADPCAAVIPEPSTSSEARVQSQARLTGSAEFRTPLWRNNNGAMTTDDGRHVRFGLGNDSAAVNKKWKSADLIGIRPVLIMPHHVGTTVGQFTAAEVKAPGWRLQPSDKRAQAQSAFIRSVQSFGGRAGFIQSEDDIRRLLS
ncbi:MAG: putative nuclease [Prokaryotic dsDNA virus sp.]|nr:MAG: putative nuclease [Prokaryotic dsDNA virus sp.]|tara:strand:+ start:3274 stop:3783 length:510 start_codon:yes stop_codon:yes gene_type:complete